MASQKYSVNALKTLINRLKQKLKYEQTDWNPTIEVIREMGEFLVYSAKSKESVKIVEEVKKENLLGLVVQVMHEASEITPVFSQIL